MNSETSPICLRLARCSRAAAFERLAPAATPSGVVVVVRPAAGESRSAGGRRRTTVSSPARDALVRERAVDELLEVLDRRFASNIASLIGDGLRLDTSHHGLLQGAVPMRFCAIFGQIIQYCAAVVCPLCGTRKARRGVPGARPADLRGLLRHQAAGGDSTVRATASISPPPRASRRRSPSASSSTTSTLLVQLHARLQRAAVAAVLPDQHVPRCATSRRSCSRSSTTTSPKRRPRWPATFETASRGVIYEHRPASLPAERLATALKPVLAEAGRARRIGVRARRGGRPAARRGSGARRERGRRRRPIAAPSSSCSAACSRARQGRRGCRRRTPPADAPRLIVP